MFSITVSKQFWNISENKFNWTDELGTVGCESSKTQMFNFDLFKITENNKKWNHFTEGDEWKICNVTHDLSEINVQES